jgi:hypothetical protein
MVLFKINCLIKTRYYQFTSICRRICGQAYRFDSVEIARAIWELDLPPAKLDIGKLTYEYLLDDEKYPDARHFVLDKLKTQNLQKKSNLRM